LEILLLHFPEVEVLTENKHDFLDFIEFNLKEEHVLSKGSELIEYEVLLSYYLIILAFILLTFLLQLQYLFIH
jgi:hypothetical protein